MFAPKQYALVFSAANRYSRPQAPGRKKSVLSGEWQSRKTRS
jgi:hypothetical protein